MENDQLVDIDPLEPIDTLPIDISGAEVEDEFIPAQMFEEISAPEVEDQPIIEDAETPDIIETDDDPAVDTTESDPVDANVDEATDPIDDDQAEPSETEDPVAETEAPDETEATDEPEEPVDLAEEPIDETPEEISDETEEPIDETPEEILDETEEPTAELIDETPDEISDETEEPIDETETTEPTIKTVAQLDSGKFIVTDKSGTVTIDFLSINRSYRGQLGIFSLSGLEDYDPNSVEFIKEAATRAISNSTLGGIVIDDHTQGARFGTVTTDTPNSAPYIGPTSITLKPGDSFSLIFIPQGTLDLIAQNPEIDGTARPIFSLAGINSPKELGIGQIVDLDGRGQTFAIEDRHLNQGADKDYNDLIFQIRGAKGNTVSMDSMVNPSLDWRETTLGQKLMSYIKPPANQPVIGVIDTGFTLGNPLIDQYLIHPLHDYVAGDANPFLGKGESSSHGDVITEIIATPLPETPALIIAGTSTSNVVSDVVISAEQQETTTGANPATNTQENPPPPSITPQEPVENIPSQAPIYQSRAIGSGQWAIALIDFVDAAKESGQQNAVANLSFDLTQIDAQGHITPRNTFTPQEIAALEYAQQNQVVIVASAGNTGGLMSALGQSSQHFDNIITVGSGDSHGRYDYSSYGQGLSIIADGGTPENPVITSLGATLGTSVATAKVTQAVAQVWAANPELRYIEVISILEQTATDVGTPGWDAQTGAGLLNTTSSIQLAKATRWGKSAIINGVKLSLVLLGMVSTVSLVKTFLPNSSETQETQSQVIDEIESDPSLDMEERANCSPVSSSLHGFVPCPSPAPSPSPSPTPTPTPRDVRKMSYQEKLWEAMKIGFAEKIPKAIRDIFSDPRINALMAIFLLLMIALHAKFPKVMLFIDKILTHVMAFQLGFDLAQFLVKADKAQDEAGLNSAADSFASFAINLGSLGLIKVAQLLKVVASVLPKLFKAVKNADDVPVLSELLGVVKNPELLIKLLDAVGNNPQLLLRLVTKVRNPNQLLALLKKVPNPVQLENLLIKVPSPNQLITLLEKVPDLVQLENLLFKVPKPNQLLSLLNKVPDPIQLENLLLKVLKPDQLLALLNKVPDLIQLENLLLKVTNPTQLLTLLNKVSNPTTLIGLLEKVTNPSTLVKFLDVVKNDVPTLERLLVAVNNNALVLENLLTRVGNNTAMLERLLNAVGNNTLVLQRLLTRVKNNGSILEELLSAVGNNIPILERLLNHTKNNAPVLKGLLNQFNNDASKLERMLNLVNNNVSRLQNLLNLVGGNVARLENLLSLVGGNIISLEKLLILVGGDVSALERLLNLVLGSATNKGPKLENFLNLAGGQGQAYQLEFLLNKAAGVGNSNKVAKLLRLANGNASEIERLTNALLDFSPPTGVGTISDLHGYSGANMAHFEGRHTFKFDFINERIKGDNTLWEKGTDVGKML